VMSCMYDGYDDPLFDDDDDGGPLLDDEEV
jgi:hypothetical protein